MNQDESRNLIISRVGLLRYTWLWLFGGQMTFSPPLQGVVGNLCAVNYPSLVKRWLNKRHNRRWAKKIMEKRELSRKNVGQYESVA